MCCYEVNGVTLLAWQRFILRTVVVYALNWILFWPGPTSTALAAASTSSGGVLLGGGKMSSGGSYQFSFTGSAGQTYPISVSTDRSHRFDQRFPRGAGSELTS
jgi:hypothetical protein